MSLKIYCVQIKKWTCRTSLLTAFNKRCY